MKKGLLFGPRDLRIVEVERPTPAEDEALVRVVRFSPYGTDLDLYTADGWKTSKYPIGVGADFAGIVDSVGANVRHFQAGDRVAALELIHCGECRYCRDGKTNLCVMNEGTNLERQECCEEYAIVKANKLARLPANVSFDDGAMLGGLVMGLNIFEKLAPQADDRIVVIGVGAMGWSCIALASLYGARVVAVGGTGRRRVELARAMGAGDVISMNGHDEDVSQGVQELLPGGAECVVETTTSDWGVRQALMAAGVSSRVALTGGSSLPVSGWDLVGREITVFGVKAGHHQDQALRLIASGRIDFKPTITSRMSLDQAPDAFALLTGPEASETGRIMIDVDGSSI